MRAPTYRHGQRLLGYRFSQTTRPSNAGVLVAYVRVTLLRAKDAMRDVKANLTSADMGPYYARIAAAVKNLTGDTIFLDDRADDSEFCLRWQANPETPDQWYAPRIEGGDANLDTIKAMAKVVAKARELAEADPARRGWNAAYGPRHVIAAVEALGGCAVRYASGSGTGPDQQHDLGKFLVDPEPSLPATPAAAPQAVAA